MDSIKSLELIYSIQQNNLKSKEDCIVAAFHCLLINHKFGCVGTGDAWPESDSTRPSELLPSNWNDNQDVYSLRYISKDGKTRVLLKFTKMEHILQVDAVKNEEAVSSVSIPTAKYVSDDYNEYSSAYKDLESLCESFHKDIMQKFQGEPKEKEKSSDRSRNPSSSPSCSSPMTPPPVPTPPLRSPADLRQDRNPFNYPRLPRYGGSDLDPFGGNGGGMIMDPSNFGIPSRPTLPQFGVGGPGGLPRGAVPPGARFDPFMPPIFPDRPARGRGPDPDHFRPPDYDEFM